LIYIIHINFFVYTATCLDRFKHSSSGLLTDQVSRSCVHFGIQIFYIDNKFMYLTCQILHILSTLTYWDPKMHTAPVLFICQKAWCWPFKKVRPHTIVYNKNSCASRIL